MTATKASDEIFLIDSNVLIYNYDEADPAKHKTAKALLDSCWKGGMKFAVSSQNLSEFFYVTTRKNILDKKKAIIIISDIINFPGWIKISFDHNTVLEAAKISEEHNMHYWDALLAATMRQNNVLSIYTENAKDFHVPWLNVVDPFRKK